MKRAPMKTCLIHAEAWEALDYNPLTGILTRKKRKNIIPRRAGSISALGYRAIRVNGKNFVAHRIIWLMMTGSWPEHTVDHINLDKDDNRWSNLREATLSQNKYNIAAIGASGLKGAYKVGNRWRSRIKNVSLGYFKTPEEAHAAYLAAVTKIAGEFARAA